MIKWTEDILLLYCIVSWEGKVIQYIWKSLLPSVIARHSLYSFQELRTRGRNDQVGLRYSVVFIFREETVFLIPLLWKRSQWSPPGFQASNLSQPCEQWWGLFVEVKKQGQHEMQLPPPPPISQAPETWLYDGLVLAIQAVVQLLFLLRITNFTRKNKPSREKAMWICGCALLWSSVVEEAARL